MSDIDTKLYDAMGQRFGIVTYMDNNGETKVIITTDPDKWTDPDNTEWDNPVRIIAKDLRYSEAQGIVKLLGDSDG